MTDSTTLKLLPDAGHTTCKTIYGTRQMRTQAVIWRRSKQNRAFDWAFHAINQARRSSAHLHCTHAEIIHQGIVLWTDAFWLKKQK